MMVGEVTRIYVRSFWTGWISSGPDFYASKGNGR